MRLSRADVSSRGCCRDEVIGPSFVSATSYEITEQQKKKKKKRKKKAYCHTWNVARMKYT